MNIGMLLETLALNNGVSRVAFALTEEFVKRGHEVCLYSSRNLLPEGGRRQFPNPKISFRWLPSLRGSWRTWSLPVGALAPLDGRHDIVVSHALTIKQDVIVMHNDPQRVETEKLAAVPFAIDLPRLRTTRRKLRAAIERLRFAPDNYRGALVHSRRSAREVRSTFGVPEDRIAVIPHGVDSAYFCPTLAIGRRIGLRERLGISLREIVFLYMGDSWKGLEFAIRGIALLPKSAPVTLLAAGPFPKKLFAQFAREQGIRFLRQELWDDARSLYSVADALIAPTPMDTFSLIGLEAMSMRLPIVTTQYAGISELLTHGENAFILENSSNPIPIAEACLTLLEPDVRLRMAENARRLAAAQSWEQPALLHLRCYAALLGRKNTEPIRSVGVNSAAMRPTAIESANP